MNRIFEGKGGKLYVEETFNLSYIKKGYASAKDLGEFYNTHKNIRHHEEWDGGDNPYSSGCPEHLTGERPATEKEIEKYNKEIEKYDREKKKKDRKRKAYQLKDVKKKAKELGYKLVKEQ